jgi:hypothetical protein
MGLISAANHYYHLLLMRNLLAYSAEKNYINYTRQFKMRNKFENIRVDIYLGTSIYI